MQQGFDFSGLKQQLGPTYEAFVSEWLAFQKLLAGRGHAIVPAGRILAGLVERYGEPLVKQAVQLSKAPGWQRAHALILAFEWLRDAQLSDAQAAVLDSIVYGRMSRPLRQKALQMMKEGRSVQEIDDMIDALKPPGGTTPPLPKVTEAEVRDAYAASLEREGWSVRKEQDTEDGGSVDIVATMGDDLLIAECKVDLTRASCIEALGQLTVYSQTFRNAVWRVAYWRPEESSGPVTGVCGTVCQFHKVAMVQQAA
jgi:hypothetical protein